MSHWKPDWIERGENSFHLARSRLRCDGSRGNEIPNAAPVSARSFLRVTKCAALCTLAFVGWGSEISRAQQPDFDVYARAVEYCRGSVKRPMALDLDKRVLCFDGDLNLLGSHPVVLTATFMQIALFSSLTRRIRASPRG